MYKILVVDDESIEREGISFLIEKYKFPLEVAQATNGKTALEYMRTHPIDILLTDVKMPQMDGLELARHTFEKYPDVRILVFSAYGEFEFAKKAMAAQAVSYLLKPIEVDEFQRVMAQILARCDELAEKKKDEQQRGEEYRQQLLFRLVTGTGLGKAHITEEWFSGQTLCLLHVQTENDYFATNEDAFCQMLKDCTQYKFEYINTYPDEAFVLFYSKYDLSDRLGDKLKGIQEKLRQNGCEASLLLGIDFTGLENISARAQALSRIRNELYEAPDALLLEKEIGESVSYYAEAIEKLRAEVQAALNEHHPEIFLSAVQRLIFGILASRIGRHEDAYTYFAQSARMDLDDYHDNFYAGIHAANMAGTWQSIVFGFAGLRLVNGVPEFKFYIPEAWNGYHFTVKIKRSVLAVDVLPDGWTITLQSGDAVNFLVEGKPYKLTEKGATCHEAL